MGSFAYTCCVSSLAIEAGDKVKCLLLSKNPYYKDGKNTCYAHDIWVPRTLPITAEYNDYGSIEKWETGPAQELWMDGFQFDLIEQGTGDNSYHDVPSRKNMTFDDLLNALWEGRVQVNPHGVYPSNFLRAADIISGKGKMLSYKEKLEKSNEPVEPLFPNDWVKKDQAGVPTFQKIEKLLRDNKFVIHGNHVNATSTFSVDDLDHGGVRVRFEGGGSDWGKDAEKLAETLPLFEEYATMITAGSGAYASAADLIIRPKPGTKDYYGPRRNERDRDAPITVALTMIRADVWEALLKIKAPDDWSSKGKKTFEDYYESVKCLNAEMTYVHTKPVFSEKAEKNIGQRGMWLFSDSHIANNMGIGTHVRMMRDKCNGTLPDTFIKTLAEYGFITELLGQHRFQWMPTSSAGPQFGEWKLHVDVCKSILDVARAAKKKRDAYYK